MAYLKLLNKRVLIAKQTSGMYVRSIFKKDSESEQLKQAKNMFEFGYESGLVS